MMETGSPAADGRARLLGALYQRGGVDRERLNRLVGGSISGGGEGLGGRHLDEQILGLLQDGLVASGPRIQLTPKGEKMAYALRGRAHPLKELLDQAQTTLPSSGRFLDLGCGPGNHLREMVASERSGSLAAFGMDRDPEALEIARGAVRTSGMATGGTASGGTAPLIQGDATLLPFLSGSFDAILCAVVLPYVNERKTLGEATRILKPGGRLILTVHGPGYYIDLIVSGDRTLRRRAFGLLSLLGTTARIRIRRSARFHSRRRITRLLAPGGVRVTTCITRGRRLGLATGYVIVAEKER